VIITVVTVRVVQVSINEVIDVVAMRDRFMPAIGAVDMAIGVGG